MQWIGCLVKSSSVLVKFSVWFIVVRNLTLGKRENIKNKYIWLKKVKLVKNKLWIWLFSYNSRSWRVFFLFYHCNLPTIKCFWLTKEWYILLFYKLLVAFNFVEHPLNKLHSFFKLIKTKKKNAVCHFAKKPQSAKTCRLLWTPIH